VKFYYCYMQLSLTMHVFSFKTFTLKSNIAKPKFNVTKQTENKHSLSTHLFRVFQPFPVLQYRHICHGVISHFKPAWWLIFQHSCSHMYNTYVLFLLQSLEAYNEGDTLTSRSYGWRSMMVNSFAIIFFSVSFVVICIILGATLG